MCVDKMWVLPNKQHTEQQCVCSIILSYLSKVKMIFTCKSTFSCKNQPFLHIPSC